MSKNEGSSLASGVASLVLVSLLTIPSILALASHLRAAKSKVSTIYKDKDGVATPESTKQFSAKGVKVLFSVFSIAGLLTSIALAVLDTLHDLDGLFLENWFTVAQWTLIIIQNISIVSSRDSIKTYSLGLCSAFSSVFLLAACLFQDGLLAQDPSFTQSAPAEHITLRTVQLVLTIAVAGSSVSLPRRPEVFLNGKPVDRMYTVSAFGRYSFSWMSHLLRLARTKARLELSDLPKMDHHTRSKDLIDTWQSEEHNHRLWVEIFLSHRWAFVIQWSLTMLQAIGNFAPQFVVYHILKILEQRVPGEQVGFDAWIWVISLTLVTGIAACIEAWLYWISWSEIAIPVRAQISALVFSKSMRRKDVKGATKPKSAAEPVVGNAAAHGSTTADTPEVDEDEDSDPKGKQSTVNLIGVDAKRVSDFCSFNNYFAGSAFKLGISLAFLLSILGWKPVLAGFTAMGLTTPVNIYFSKRYSAAQDRLMKVRDAKMGVVTEALQGIRQIKFNALETKWDAKIGKVREKELAEQWAVFKSDTMLCFCWITGPIALAATSLAVYAWTYDELTPSIAFTSIGVFSSLEVVLGVIPELTTDLIDAWISINRIEKYLNAPEITKSTSNSPDVCFDNASIAWPSDDEKEAGDLRYVLRNLNITFPKGELSVVSGKTGTGKSLLLAAILGEVDVLSGKINVPRPPPTQSRFDHLANKSNWIIASSVAFVAQIPWIENASIKDNILFGLPDDSERYKKVIEVCALRKDLDMLTDGEATEIGANGINLSGGQRWRVTFARALYSRAGILVLDDIFSAVDAHVGRFLFEKALCGELGLGRTRILVTHHVALCESKTKYIVELGDGTVENCGLTEDLQEDGTLAQIMSHQEEGEQEIEADEDPTAVNSEESSDGETTEALKKVDSKVAPKKFIEEEARERGRVQNRVYLTYLKDSGGWPFWLVALLAFASQQVLITGRSWWVRLWTGQDEEQHTSMMHAYSYTFQSHSFSSPYNNSTRSAQSVGSTHHNLKYYLSIYILMSIISAVVGTFRWYFIFTGSIRASRRLFEKLSFTILRTPLRWMDTVPLGRILNRFTADFNVIDARLSNDVAGIGGDIFRLFGIIIAGILISPYIILLALILLAICIQIARLYIIGAREVKRLEASAKSPVFEQFGSALTGVGTIRAFDKSSTYITRMYDKIDDYSTAYWHLWAFNRWMGWRMALVGSLFATFVSISILLITNIDASLAGFALSFALEYGSVVIWTIRHYANLELEMNACERVIEYSNLPTESQDGIDPPAHWPSEGKMEVADLVVGYAADLPPVLKGLSFSVKRKERIGVVGRTGAGKSSLTLALFRFLEAREGSIFIDGLDISTIKLQALRSRLAIIPQDPVLFSGTVRSNLDAFDEHSDNDLRDALLRVHLISQAEFDGMSSSPTSTADPAIISTLDTSGTSIPATPTTTTTITNTNPFTTLTSPITESGSNLSQGQRQLLCLARAIVARPKIMVLDEATSAVDMATDARIQRSIREEFEDATLIVIAHRLSTIADFDKILVLSEGRAVEFGTPVELWAKGKDGGEEAVFAGMVRESGERERLVGVIEGRGEK